MHEEVAAAVVRRDEAVALLVVEPLDRSGRHMYAPFLRPPGALRPTRTSGTTCLSSGQPIRPNSRECTSRSRSEWNFSARLGQAGFRCVRTIRRVIGAADAALAVAAEARRLRAPAVRRRPLDVVGFDAQPHPCVARLLALHAAEP